MPAPAPAATPAVSTAAGDADEPEGPPATAGITAPELVLSPKPEDLQYPPTDAIYETDDDTSSKLNIYQVDIDSLPEKPWRRPGANLSDWFNYGFDEATWAMWCAQKNRMGQARAEFANTLQAANEGEAGAEPGFGPGASGDAQNPMANLTAMFAPGMMGMPGMQWPMMMPPGAPQGAPTDAMPMMGMPPPEGQDVPPWAASAAPPPAAPGGVPPADDARSGQEPDDGDAHGARSRRGGRDTRSAPRSGNASRRNGRLGADDRSPPPDDDAYAPELHPTATRREYYNDRDSEAGPGDALDYGASAPHGESDRWYRRQTTPRYDDERYAYDDAPRGGRDRDRDRDRDRHGRRDRDRARSDRRAGRGGQKRGPPEADDYGASKRFNGGR